MPRTRHIVIPVLAAAAAIVPCTTGAVAISQASTTASTQSAATTPAVPRISAKVLRPGSKGRQVKTLQQLLNRVGVKVAVTGNYLSETSKAVQHFQVAASLSANGIAGQSTIAALRLAARGPRSAGSSGGVSFGDDQRSAAPPRPAHPARGRHERP